jgi:hypothetical protein
VSAQMQALSVRQPAASLIVDGDKLLGAGLRKNIENRSRILFDEKKWRLPFCILVHSSKARMKGGVVGRDADLQLRIDALSKTQTPVASIIGAARVAGMKPMEELPAADQDSPWITGPVRHVLLCLSNS